uniref:Uncharacterized protein n=1 Tax=Ditylenchus dipsaci TaxID=166011 RepID=A0A915DFB7_9BILA
MIKADLLFVFHVFLILEFVHCQLKFKDLKPLLNPNDADQSLMQLCELVELVNLNVKPSLNSNSPFSVNFVQPEEQFLLPRLLTRTFSKPAQKGEPTVWAAVKQSWKVFKTEVKGIAAHVLQSKQFPNKNYDALLKHVNTELNRGEQFIHSNKFLPELGVRSIFAQNVPIEQLIEELTAKIVAEEKSKNPSVFIDIDRLESTHRLKA